VITAFIWTGLKLVPYEQDDLDRLCKVYGPGDLVSVDVKKARHLGHHRKHMARFREAVERGCTLYGNRFNNVDAMRAFVYVCIGWADYYDMGPTRVPVPKSVNWSSVDQTAFEPVDQQCVLFLAENLVPPLESITADADELIARGVERILLKDAA
jgi:hypothetical protein